MKRPPVEVRIECLSLKGMKPADPDGFARAVERQLAALLDEVSNSALIRINPCMAGMNLGKIAKSFGASDESYARRVAGAIFGRLQS